MSNEQFSLCWDNFHKNMSSGMNSLLESEDLVDVTLAIEGKYLKAHKMILSVCSPYFRTLFSVNPCKHPIVFMKDISYVVMNDLLTFMYQGEVQVNQENLATFIKTAEALQIKGLTGDNNDVEEVVPTVETTLKRPVSTDEPKMKTIKKQSVQIPSKKPKLSPPTPETEIVIAPIKDRESNSECVSTTNISTERINFKMEPYDTIQEDEPIENNYDDSQVTEYHAESMDGGKEYIMEEEEPQASTSGDTMGDSEVSASDMQLDPISNDWEHFPGYITPTKAKQRPQRRCRVCSKNGLRSETTRECKKCLVALHFPDCFDIYHSINK